VKENKEEGMQAVQVVRALLAARKLKTILRQPCTKKETTRRWWGRGRRMTRCARALLTNTQGEACPRSCGGPPSSTTYDDWWKLL